MPHRQITCAAPAPQHSARRVLQRRRRLPLHEQAIVRVLQTADGEPLLGCEFLLFAFVPLKEGGGEHVKARVNEMLGFRVRERVSVHRNDLALPSRGESHLEYSFHDAVEEVEALRPRGAVIGHKLAHCRADGACLGVQGYVPRECARNSLRLFAAKPVRHQPLRPLYATTHLAARCPLAIGHSVADGRRRRVGRRSYGPRPLARPHRQTPSVASL